MIGFVHHHNRCLAASSHTTADFEGDQPVWSSLTGFDTQNLLGFVYQLRSSANVAGSANAEFHDMFAAGFCGEERIKRHHTMDLAHWNTQFFGNVRLHWFGDKAHSLLEVVENYHQSAILISEF